MSRTGLVRFAAVYAALVAILVVVIAGYYEGPGLLVMQLALIGGPSFVPFLPLTSKAEVPRWMIVAVAAVIGAGWAMVVYEDTRPYTGGGASMAVLFGWLTCIVATLLALALLAVRGAIRARRGDEPPR